MEYDGSAAVSLDIAGLFENVLTLTDPVVADITQHTEDIDDKIDALAIVTGDENYETIVEHGPAVGYRSLAQRITDLETAISQQQQQQLANQPIIETGSVTTDTSVNNGYATVVFSKEFPAPPKVIATTNISVTTSGNTTTTSGGGYCAVRDVTTTQFLVVAFTPAWSINNITSSVVNWVAVYDPESETSDEQNEG